MAMGTNKGCPSITKLVAIPTGRYVTPITFSTVAAATRTASGEAVSKAARAALGKLAADEGHEAGKLAKEALAEGKAADPLHRMGIAGPWGGNIQIVASSKNRQRSSFRPEIQVTASVLIGWMAKSRAARHACQRVIPRSC